jgi:predicted GNAT family acetyltransferase
MNVKITNNTLKQRFETEVGSKTAFLNYRLEKNRITYTHTEVPASLEGRGIGTALAKAALEYASAQGLRVVPQCPFVAAFVKAHSHYQSLVDQ